MGVLCRWPFQEACLTNRSAARRSRSPHDIIWQGARRRRRPKQGRLMAPENFERRRGIRPEAAFSVPGESCGRIRDGQDRARASKQTSRLQPGSAAVLRHGRPSRFRPQATAVLLFGNPSDNFDVGETGAGGSRGRAAGPSGVSRKDLAARFGVGRKAREGSAVLAANRGQGSRPRPRGGDGRPAFAGDGRPCRSSGAGGRRKPCRP